MLRVQPRAALLLRAEAGVVLVLTVTGTVVVIAVTTPMLATVNASTTFVPIVIRPNG